jgi:hypothetical protein
VGRSHGILPCRFSTYYGRRRSAANRSTIAVKKIEKWQLVNIIIIDSKIKV